MHLLAEVEIFRSVDNQWKTKSAITERFILFISTCNTFLIHSSLQIFGKHLSFFSFEEQLKVASI